MIKHSGHALLIRSATASESSQFHTLGGECSDFWRVEEGGDLVRRLADKTKPLQPECLIDLGIVLGKRPDRAHRVRKIRPPDPLEL